MDAEHERWAETLAIERWKGPECDAYVAERIAALTEAGDTAGVERFTTIAAKLARLRAGPAQ